MENPPAVDKTPSKWKHLQRSMAKVGILLAGLVWIWLSRVPPGTLQVEPALPFVGFTAPPFSLQTTSGTIISTTTFSGQPVIINIWATWCPPCRAEMPALENTFQNFREEGLVVLGVNASYQDDPGTAAAFAQEMGLSFPILLDLDGEVTSRYQLQAMPTTYFIDAKGVIREIVVGGPMSEALLNIRAQQLIED